MPDPLHLHMLESLAEMQANGDRKAIFLDCYQRMTRNMLKAAQTTCFEDPVWVDELLRRFAEYYFEGLEAYRLDRITSPVVWQAAHGAAQVEKTGPLQLLLLGVNAHINYDLVLTLIDQLQDEWDQSDDEARALRQRDHRRVNDIIAATIDEVQDEVLAVESPDLALIDQLMGRLDEWLISKLIKEWREEVWDSAVAVLEEPGEEARRGILEEVEKKAVRFARMIMGKRQVSFLPIFNSVE